MTNEVGLAEGMANLAYLRGVAHQSAGLAEGCTTREYHPLEAVAEEEI